MTNGRLSNRVSVSAASLRRFVVLAGVAILTYALGAAPYRPAGGTLRIVADMDVSVGRAVYVFLNDLGRKPAVAAPEPGVRRTYSFTFPREPISLLRLDPTDVAGSVVRIYGVEVFDGDRVVARFGPAELRSWFGGGFTASDESQALVITSITDDPMLVTFQPIAVSGDQGWTFALRQLLIHRPYSLPLMLLPILVGAWSLGRRDVLALLVLGAVWVAVPFILHEAPGWRLGRETLNVAVSRAAFLGHSLRNNQLAGLTTLAVAVALGLAAGLWRRRGERIPLAAALHPEADEPRNTRLLVSCWIALTVLMAPDMSSAISNVGSLTYIPHWDQDLLTYWAAAVTRGQLPFRDFWYPYGGQFLFDLAWPRGPMVRWIFDVLLFGSLTTSVLLLAPRRRFAALALVATLIVADRIGLVFTLNRYLLGPNLVLAFLAVSRVRRLGAGVALHALIAILLPLVFDPMQVATAAVATGAVWLAEHRVSWWKSVAAAKQALTVPMLFAAAGALTVAVLLGLMAMTGQLRGAVDFYLTVGDTLEYASFPTPLDRLGWNLFDLQLGVVWWPIAAIAVGLYARLAARDAESALWGASLLAFGVAAFMVEQKHLMRPMDYQLLVYPLLGSLVFALLTPAPFPTPTAIGLAAAAGLFAALVTMPDRVERAIAIVGQAPARITGTLRVVFDRDLAARANVERFAPERFVRYPNEREVVSTLDAAAPGPLTLFSLTDAPTLYTLTRQAVWISNMYDASPVDEQRRAVSWLRRSRPEFVVFQAGQLEFDSVPLTVRVPDVLAEIVATYVPDRRIGRYEVLRPRHQGDRFPIEYWTKQLGATLAMGHVPARIDISARAPCGGAPVCDQYLVADVDDARIVKPRGVTLRVGDAPLRIEFETEPGARRYVVPVSRLWFWRAAVESGVPVVLEPTDEGLNAHWLKITPDAARLY